MFKASSAAMYVPDLEKERCGVIVTFSLGFAKVQSKEEANDAIATLEMEGTFTRWDIQSLRIEVGGSDLFDTTAEYLNWRMLGDSDKIIPVRTSPKGNDLAVVEDALQPDSDNLQRLDLD